MFQTAVNEQTSSLSTYKKNNRYSNTYIERNYHHSAFVTLQEQIVLILLEMKQPQLAKKINIQIIKTRKKQSKIKDRGKGKKNPMEQLQN